MARGIAAHPPKLTQHPSPGRGWSWGICACDPNSEARNSMFLRTFIMALLMQDLQAEKEGVEKQFCSMRQERNALAATLRQHGFWGGTARARLDLLQPRTSMVLDKTFLRLSDMSKMN